MSDPIYPGAVWRPGVNAGYRAGRTRMHVAVCHFTVGVNSAPIGDRGYFQFLVSRDGTVTQFAEVDALCWHAGEWNVYGPGIEVEYWSAVDGDQIFTDAARAATAALIAWLNVEWGIPLTYYDGERQSTSDQTGFMSHRSLMQTDPHHDFWPQTDWDLMVAPAPPVPAPAPPVLPSPDSGDDMLTLCYNPDRQTLVCTGVGADQRPYFAEQSADGSWTDWTAIGSVNARFCDFVKQV